MYIDQVFLWYRNYSNRVLFFDNKLKGLEREKLGTYSRIFTIPKLAKRN
jgi:hypothetical protein